MHAPPPGLPQSPHFTFHELAPGVFAAIATEAGAAVSNAGIVDLGDRTLVFDTSMTPQAACDLRAAAQELTGRDPGIIINSHYHNDHIWGNQVFDARAHICCSTKTLELIATEGAGELSSARETAARRLQDARRQYEQIHDEVERRHQHMSVAYYQALVDALPDLEVRLPDITFEDRLFIHGSDRGISVIPFAGAHTGSDAILYLRRERVIFMADLLFVDFHPYLAEGNVEHLLHALTEIEKLQAATLVPGHGPVGTTSDLELNMDYVSDCTQTAQRLVAAGDASPERIQQEKIPDRFESWGLPRFFWVNIQSLCSRLGAPAPGTG